MSNKNFDSNNLDGVINLLSQKLNANPNDLKSNLKEGNIDAILQKLNQKDAAKIKDVLSDKSKTSNILSSPQAKKMMEKLLGEK